MIVERKPDRSHLATQRRLGRGWISHLANLSERAGTGRTDPSDGEHSACVADRVHNRAVLFADLVAVSRRVKVLESRQDKVAELSAFFRTGTAIDVPIWAELLVRDDLFTDPLDNTHVSGEIEPRDHSSLPCATVLDAIVEIDRAPASAIRRNLIHQLLARATIDEQRWIVNAVESDRLDTRTFDLIISSAARSSRVTVGALRRAASLTGSLPLAVRIAAERGGTGLQSVTIEPGRPIVLTLAGPKEPPEALLELAKTHLVEIFPRTDRIQVHRVRGEIFVYDDQLRDVTDAAPAVVEQVAAFSRGDLVLDGWVDIARAAGTESTTVANPTRRRDALRPDGPARFFDVMFDGAAIVDEPLANRRTLLRSVVPEASLLPVLEITSLDDVARTLNSAIRSGHNGVVLKPLDEPYEGGLVRSSWRTIDAAHVVKLAVTAVDRGSGSRSDLASSVHLAARDDRGRFHDVGTTKRSLSEQTVAWQTAAFASLMVDEEPGQVAQLRPGIVSIVAIDGVGSSGQMPDQLTVEQPQVLGYQQGSRADVTSFDDLRVIAEHGADETLETGRGDFGDGAEEQPILPQLPAAPPVSARTTSVGGPEFSGEGAPLPSALDARPQAGLRERRAIAGLQPYQEPVIPTTRAPWRAVIAARAVTMAWVLALLIAALAERAGAGDTTGDTVSAVGRGGGVVALLLAVTGWWWSDQLVRTLIQLDGRRPGRIRCVSAWLIPPTVVLLIALLVVPLDPTEPADVRPILIVPAFALVMWRPYSLIRRILATLIRLRSDAILASAYIIDLLGFGVLWWQLTQWEQRDEVVSSRQLDVLIGTVAAVSIFMIMSTVLWIGVLRTARNAVAHRRSSQRTRFEHRMLRLSGIDPTDPEIWWALVQRRADEERAAAAREEATEDLVALPTVDQLVENAKRDHGVEFRRLDDDETRLLEDRLRTEFTAILAERGLTTGQSGADAAVTDTASQTATADAPTRRDLKELINQAGSLQIQSAIAAHLNKAGQDGPGARLLPPRLVALEACRLVMVAVFGALTITTGWLVAIAMGSDAIAGTNELDPSVLNDIEVARGIIWGLLTVGGAIVPLWALMMLRQARLAGIAGLRERSVRVLLLVAVVACTLAFVTDADRGGPTLLLALLIIWTAVSAGLAVEPIRLWYEVPAATLTAWIATLPVILGITWLAGLTAAVEPTVSLQRLAFTTILLTLACARVTVMSWLSSVDLEDEFRVAPELAVPARAEARR